MEREQDTSPDQNLEKFGLNTEHFPSIAMPSSSSLNVSSAISREERDKNESLIEKELLMHAIEVLQDIYLLIDVKKRRIIRWNRVVEELTGLTEEITFQKLFSRIAQEKIFETITDITNEKAVTATVSITSINGSEVPIAFRFSSKQIPPNTNYVTAIGRDIRSDVESSKKLIESRNKYESIFNSTEDGIVIFDPMNGVVDCNRSALTLFHYSDKPSFLNTSFLSLSTPLQLCETDSSLLFKQYLEDIILFGTKVFKWKFVTLEGTPFPASVAISKFIYEGKTLFNARIRDISLEQKRLELLFMERNISISLQSETSTEAILSEAIDHLLTLSDITSGVAFLFSNKHPRNVSSCGYPPPEGISECPLGNIIHATTTNGDCHFFSAIELLNSHSISIMPYKASIWIPQYHGDDIVGAILLFSNSEAILTSEMKGAIDIVTGIIQNAVVRSKAEEKLRRSEERHRNLVENAPYGIFLSNFENEIIDVNRAACNLTNRTQSELLGTKIADLIAKNKRSEFIRNMQKLILSGLFFGEYPVEEKKSGEQFWSIHSVKLSDDQALSFVKDVSKIKELELRINQKEKMEAIGQLAGGIAHDFNNQLTGIIGYSELLKDSLKEDEELSEYIDFILTATQRSSEITSQLLAYARKGKYINKSLDIHSILHEVLDLLKHTVDKRILLEERFFGKPLMIRGDSAQLQNMFLNLAINARDAMPEGGKLEFLTTELKDSTTYTKNTEFNFRPGKYAHIIVKDSGTGMDEETMKRVFEPFFTTKEKGKGTGMGLAAAYGTVKNHRGYIQIESEVDRGTEFHIFLPIADEKIIDDHSIESLEKADAKVFGSGSILIVDDDELICNTLSNSLSKLGYETAVCYNGLDAIDYYQSHWMNINLVILDMVMPLMSGKDTFFELQKINENCNVVISSGFTSDSDVETLLSAGAKKFIQKPYSINNISATIFDLINS